MKKSFNVNTILVLGVGIIELHPEKGVQRILLRPGKNESAVVIEVVPDSSRWTAHPFFPIFPATFKINFVSIRENIILLREGQCQFVLPL